MNDLPHDIADCDTDEERAKWLLQCPLRRLVLEEDHIRYWLRLNRFSAGSAYLDNMLSVLREDRREDGRLLHFMAFATTNGRLYRVALGMAPVGLGD